MPEIRAADGCRLYAESSGEGPAIVLIPGLGGSARFWSVIAPALAGKFRVISFDHRGAGRSEKPEGPYTIDGLAFEGADRHQDITAPTLVIGASDDNVVAFEQSVAVAEHIPNARLPARRGGHFYPRVDPNGFVSDVVSFVGEVP